MKILRRRKIGPLEASLAFEADLGLLDTVTDDAIGDRDSARLKHIHNNLRYLKRLVSHAANWQVHRAKILEIHPKLSKVDAQIMIVLRKHMSLQCLKNTNELDDQIATGILKVLGDGNRNAT